MKCMNCNNTDEAEGFEDIFNNNNTIVNGFICQQCGYIMTFNKQIHIKHLESQEEQGDE